MWTHICTIYYIFYLGVDLGNPELQYKFVNLRKNWYDAELYCKSVFGTRLAIITNHFDNIAATSICSGHECWIGANDRSKEGKFKYTNGDSVSFTNWARHEPNNLGYYTYNIF